MNRLILYFILLCACCGCSNTQQQAPKAFQHQIQLQGEEILTEAFATLEIHVLDSLLLTQNRKHEYAFSLYNMEGKAIANICKLGEGPQEWHLPGFVAQTPEGNVWVHDSGRHQICLIDPRTAPETVLRRIQYGPAANFSPDSWAVNDTLLATGMGYTSERPYRLQYYHPQKQEAIQTIEALPAVEIEGKSMAPDFYYSLYSSRLAYSASKQLLVSCMNHFDRIDIFNLDGTLKKSMGPEASPLKINAAKPLEEQTQLYYTVLRLTDQYIYALYYNQPNIEYGEKLTSTQIHVFDWEGNGVYQIHVPDYLMSFSVDEKRGYIYGVDFYNQKNLRYACERLKGGI